MEQPYTILLGGFVVVAILIGGLINTGKRALLYAAIFALVATVGLLVMERTAITPREEVKATLHVIAHELEQNNVDGVLEYVSTGRPELKADVKQKMGLVNCW